MSVLPISLEDAIEAFQQPDNPYFKQVHEWFLGIQTSPEVWQLIWREMLPNEKVEIQFFGAALLRSKLLNYWSDIPMNEYESLKNNIFNAIIFYSKAETIVLKRLCLVFVTYILRTLPTKWPTAISDIITMMQPQAIPNIPRETLAYVLLEILTLIPEELQSMVLSKNERIFIRNALDNCCIEVLPLLETALSSDTDINLRLQALKCSQAWFEFGMPSEHCDRIFDLLIQTVLLTYNDPKNDGCTIPAIEAMCTLTSHPTMEVKPDIAMKHLRKMMHLTQILNVQPDRISNKDIIPCVFTLFNTFGESHMKTVVNYLVSGRDVDVVNQLLQIAIKCSDAPGIYTQDETHSGQTCNFWYLLQEEMFSNDKLNDTTIQTIKQCYKVLSGVLLKKSIFPVDFKSWPTDAQDNFRCYRQDIADTMMYCYAVLDHEMLNDLLFGIQMVVSDRNTLGERWQQVEAYLHAFYSISENLNSVDDIRISQFIIIATTLPFSSMNIRATLTALELLGTYSEWLKYHPEVLGPALVLILNSLPNLALAPSATLALKDVCRECQLVIGPYAHEVIETTKDILRRNVLKPNDQNRLIFSMGKLLAIMPNEIIIKHLEEIVEPYIRTLQSATQELSNITEYQILCCLQIFSQLYFSMDPMIKDPLTKSPTLLLLEELLPIYSALQRRFPSAKIIAAICTTLRNALSNLKDGLNIVVPIIVSDILVSGYSYAPEPAYLEVAKQMMILFGLNAAYADLMRQLLRHICDVTIELLKSRPNANLSDYSLLLEGFYNFCANGYRKCMQLFRHEHGPDINSITYYAGLSICLPEVRTVKASSAYLCQIITSSRDVVEIRTLIESYGEELVNSIVLSMRSPRACLEHIAEVVLAFNKKYCDWLSRWLQQALFHENFPFKETVSPEMRSNFMKAVLRERASKRRMHETIKEFSLRCKGIIRRDNETTMSTSE